MSFRNKCIRGMVVFLISLLAGGAIFCAGLLYRETFFNILSFVGIVIMIAGLVFELLASRCPKCGVPIDGIIRAYCPWCGEFLDEAEKDET
ncbi:MAG: hypothetical protein LUE29_05875 [Lachnospiraceae bacterium]|nr:hypothetical protein [Lachnospiraceae bacterium]